MSTRRKIMGCLLLVSLLLAGPAMAGPVDGSGGVWGWWADAWSAVVSVFGASSEPEPEPEPAPVPPAPKGPTDGPTTDCSTCGSGGDEGDSLPGLDPNG